MAGRGIKGQSPELAARTERIAAMYCAGGTLQAIGDQFGITRERVRQLLRDHTNVAPKDGGQRKMTERKRAKFYAARDARYVAKYGCTYSQWGLIPSRARVAFVQQRGNARRRGIGWHLNLWEWWAFWQQSGKWEQRGRGKGYMMCRFGDVGAYQPGNIFVATGVHNGTVQLNNPYRVDHPKHQEVVQRLRVKRITRRVPRYGVARKRKYLGLPVGVTIHKGSGRYMAQIGINGRGKYLGMFDTPDEAHAAYVAAIPQQVAA